MLNVVLCDDNLNTLERLEKMLENIFIQNSYDADIVLSSSNVSEILDFVDRNRVDVLFLDINLKSSITGLDIAKKVRERNKNLYLIFTTAHLEYVLLAYKYKTFDFLAKPITLSRLEDTIKRLFDDIEGLPKRYIKIDNKNTIIDENVIEFIKRDGMKLVFHSDSKDYEAYSSFNKIQTNLPNNFVRCHKSFIANINLIKDVDPVVNKISFSDNTFCDIGPKYKKNFMEVLNKYENFT